MGGLRARPPRAVPPARRQPARAGRRDGAAQRARRLHPPRRGRLALGGAGRGDHRVQPGREGLVLRPGGATRPTGTRRSTRSPTRCSTCERRLPRRPSRPTPCGSATTRWCSSHRLGEWIANAPAARGGRRAGQHRARPARPGAHPAHLRRRGRGRRPHRGRPRLPARRARLPQRAARRAAERRLRASRIARQLLFSTYQLALYDGLQRQRRRDARRRRGKAVKEVDYHRDHATQWVLRLGDGTEESHRRMQAGLERSGRTPTSCSSTDDARAGAGRARASPSTPSTLRAGVGRVRRPACSAEATLTRPDGAAHAARRRPARHPHRGARLPARRDAAPAPLPPGSVLVSATTRARPLDDARARRRGGARPRGAGADHRRPRRPARRHGRPTTARVDVDGHADLLRLPGDGRRSAHDVESARARAPGSTGVEVAHRAVAGLDHRLDDRAGHGGSCRSTASRRPAGRTSPDGPGRR